MKIPRRHATELLAELERRGITREKTQRLCSLNTSGPQDPKRLPQQVQAFGRLLQRFTLAVVEGQPPDPIVAVEVAEAWTALVVEIFPTAVPFLADLCDAVSPTLRLVPTRG